MFCRDEFLNLSMSAGELNKFLNNRCWSEISKDEIYEFFTLDEKRIERMLNLAISNDTDFSWRAAWLIGKFVQSENEILKPHYLRIINAIEGKDSGHQRELLKLVINKSLTDEEEGRLFEVCIRIWKDIHKKPGTRSYAFQCIDNITTIYPELRNELMGLFGPEYLETLSPAIRKTILMKLRSTDFNAVN